MTNGQQQKPLSSINCCKDVEHLELYTVKCKISLITLGNCLAVPFFFFLTVYFVLGYSPLTML